MLHIGLPNGTPEWQLHFLADASTRMAEIAHKEFEKLCEQGLMPNTEFSRMVHHHALLGNQMEFSLPPSDKEYTFSLADFSTYSQISAFHWRAAARLAAMLPGFSLDEMAEIHWNSVMANVAATGEFFWRFSSLYALKKLEQTSERARQIANFNYCFWNPTIESFSDCLLSREMTEVERMIIQYGEACCYAMRRDEERFEYSAGIFASICNPALPSLASPIYNVIQTLRQYSKSSSEVMSPLKNYIREVRVNHISPYVRLHAEILYTEDTLSFDYWGGSIYQKIDWTLQALNTLSYAITAGVATAWYGYLQYVIAQRSSYSGIYDVARDMIEDLERQKSPYALGAKGYFLAELEQFDQSANVYEQFLRQVERDQTAAHRGESDHPPAVKQSDMAFCYYYAAQSLFNMRAHGDDKFGDKEARCAEMIEKFFVWSQYLALSARRILHEICRAMQAELNEDLVTAVTHYEEYLEVVNSDDYISKIKTLSRMAQIYAEELKNFEKADEHLQSLKKLLPTIQRNSSLPLERIEQHLDVSRNQSTTVQLWLTNYSLKATQKVLSALDTVTNQLASAYQIVEEQNNQLTAVNQSLLELNQEKNEFMGIAAHDLKSPLTGIILAIDMLERYNDRMTLDQRIKKFQDVRHTAQRMTAIITNLLDINAIETGKFNFALSSFNFSEAVKKTVDDYRERASVKNIVLNFSTGNDHADAFADPNATIEILDNLISNAVKYSPHNKNVFVQVVASEHAVRCEVRDEGPGLSEEDQSKLFGKFTRLSAKPTGGEHSTGLGLSIVKKLAETMRGNVWCESTLGRGATFVIELPTEPITAEIVEQT